MASDPNAERHREALESLGAAVLEGPGVLPPEARRAAASREGVPEPFTEFVETVHDHAYRVTDDAVSGLRASGASDDEVFEMTVAAAYGAARRRLEAGLEALRAATESS
jgi:alkylhydroperoxidase family enzyme